MEGGIITDLYYKPTDGHQCLHYDSCHTDHIKRWIIFSHTFLLKRICSEKNDLNVDVDDLKIWFRKRRYLDHLIKEQVDSLNSLRVMRIIAKKVDGVSLVLTYNPAFNGSSQVTKKILQLLYADEQVKKVFSRTTFVSFRSTKNLKSHLVWLYLSL